MQSNLELELEELLTETTKPCGVFAERNRAIITTFYGFGSEPWPTLETTGHLFGELERERIRQIIDERFRRGGFKDRLPSAQRVGQMLADVEAVQASDFIAVLRLHGVIGEGGSPYGLLKLLTDLKIDCQVDLYRWDLERAARTNARDDHDVFFIRADLTAELNRQLIAIRKAPIGVGIANLDSVGQLLGELSAERMSILRRLISATPHSWTFESGDQFWYMFEAAKKNRLISALEKVHSVTDHCPVPELAESLLNAIKRTRDKSITFPSIDVVKRYLNQSRFLSVEGATATFRSSECCKGPLTKVQKDTKNVLLSENGGRATLPVLRAKLQSLGNSRDTIANESQTSPILSVDKSLGHGSHVFRLIGHGASSSVAADLTNERYQRVREQLLEICKTGTDLPIDEQRRLEQPHLRKWMFGESAHCSCALCGRRFEIGALITAHKRPRKGCSESQRLDPHIVMPLCSFGCDYLYENEYVYIENGIACVNRVKQATPDMIVVVKSLEGKQLAERWAAGPSDYFRRPSGLDRSTLSGLIS